MVWSAEAILPSAYSAPARAALEFEPYLEGLGPHWKRKPKGPAAASPVQAMAEPASSARVTATMAWSAEAIPPSAYSAPAQAALEFEPYPKGLGPHWKRKPKGPAAASPVQPTAEP